MLKLPLTELEIRELPWFQKAGKTWHRCIPETERQGQAQREDRLSLLIRCVQFNAFCSYVAGIIQVTLSLMLKITPASAAWVSVKALAPRMRRELYIELQFNSVGVRVSRGSLPFSLLCTRQQAEMLAAGPAGGLLLEICMWLQYFINSLHSAWMLFKPGAVWGFGIFFMFCPSLFCDGLSFSGYRKEKYWRGWEEGLEEWGICKW